ncbi:hypothetical protein AABB24_030986, partial [Solanum stoloniferum]
MAIYREKIGSFGGGGKIHLNFESTPSFSRQQWKGFQNPLKSGKGREVIVGVIFLLDFRVCCVKKTKAGMGSGVGIWYCRDFRVCRTQEAGRWIFPFAGSLVAAVCVCVGLLCEEEKGLAR